MRKISSRSFMIFIMTIAFFAGIAYHTVNLIVHSAEWITYPMNDELPSVYGLEYAGKIIDRNGVILAQSIDKKRVYNENEETRKACVHVVGDSSVNISTAVQTVYRADLTENIFTGDFVFGLGLPGMFRSGDAIVTKGNDITLTIDSRLQKTAVEALSGYNGAVFVYNYKTGEILCMVSTPVYDPENVPEDIDTNPAYDGAYLNRALSAAYPPGSTFKLITADAALNEIPDIEQSVYTCTGKDKVGGQDIICFEPNGTVDIKEALAQSCNVFFAKIAAALGKEKMTYYAEKAGFNSSIKIDRIESAESVYNVTEATENELGWSGVGQYTVLETPVNMSEISAAIANGGTPVMPYLINSMKGKSSHETILGKDMMNKETADKIADMMSYTVSTSYGRSYVCDALDICAKTGTAEISDDGLAHAWITGFSRDEDCPLAFSIILECGNSSYSVAIPAANKVLTRAAELYKKSSSYYF